MHRSLHHRHRELRNRQQGAALIVGLVLMTVLTLLAVSTMRTSTLELAMAGNAQYHEQAMQLAESGLKDAVRRIENGVVGLNSDPAWQESFTVFVPAPDGNNNIGRYEVTISSKGIGQAVAGDGQPIAAIHYEIESTGLSAARNAKSTLRQGFFIRTGT